MTAHIPLSPEALRALAEAREIPVDDDLLETVAPMVRDLFDMAAEIRAWCDRHEVDGAPPLVGETS